jgi:tRNA nucleotidyltransferase (CCA-adding enzyme)
MGAAVFAVGGFVRDLLLGRSAPDVDLVVAGDGVAFARRLGEEIGGSLSVHEGFGTASIEGGTAAGGAPLGRVDVASARRERYEAPGALPVVSPAGILEDLARRDFSVNAMAVALAPSAFGRLTDPFGGQRDLRERVLRPLHPLSFVEDPTRIFRAARYAARLGMGLGVSGRAALALALRVGDYPALSGQRLRVEVDLLAAEEKARQGFEQLLAWRALRIWNREYRASGITRRALRSAERFGEWARGAGIAVDRGEVALVALVADQRRRVVGACLDRLAIRGEPRSILETAATAGPLVSRLDRTRRRSEVAEILGPQPVTVLAGAWLKASRRSRRRIEWFLSEGRAARPQLSGDEVVALGVPRGPAVGNCLAALRRFKLDGGAASVAREREYVARWLRDGGSSNDPDSKGGVR